MTSPFPKDTQSPFNRQPPNLFPAGQAPSFKTDVNRKKTRKWVEAKQYSYEGDDWGGYDDEDEYGVGQSAANAENPAARTTGIRQPGQTGDYDGASGSVPVEYPPSGPGLQRVSSFERGDEKRTFSSGTHMPHGFDRQIGVGQAQSQPASISHDSSRIIENPTSAYVDSSSLSTAPAQSSGRIPSAQGEGPPVFVRPADIYKRVEEERARERASQESSRPSLDSLVRTTTDDAKRVGSPPLAAPQQSTMYATSDAQQAYGIDAASATSARSRPLETVVERNSEYGHPGDRLHDPNSASHAQPTTGTGPVILPTLPTLDRSDEFNVDFSSSANRREADRSISTAASSHETTQVQTTSKDFQSVVNKAFERSADTTSVPPTPISQHLSTRFGTESGVSRSDSATTAGISPIMSRVPSVGHTAAHRLHDQIERENAQTALVQEERSDPEYTTIEDQASFSPPQSDTLAHASNSAHKASTDVKVATGAVDGVTSDRESLSAESARPDQATVRPAISSELSFRPQLPGQWESYSVTPDTESHQRRLGTDVVESPPVASELNSLSTTTAASAAQKQPEDDKTLSNPLAALTAAGAAMGEAIKSSMGLDATSDNKTEPSSLRQAHGDVLSRPLAAERLDSSLSTATSAPAPHDEIAELSGSMPEAPTTENKEAHISSTESALQPSFDDNHSAERAKTADVTIESGSPRFDTDQNDQLAKDIVRSLSPTKAHQIDTSDTLALPTGTEANRVSSVLPSEYESYWEGSRPDGSRYSKMPGEVEIGPQGAELTRPSQSYIQRPAFLDKRFSWEKSQDGAASSSYGQTLSHEHQQQQQPRPSEITPEPTERDLPELPPSAAGRPISQLSGMLPVPTSSTQGGLHVVNFEGAEEAVEMPPRLATPQPVEPAATVPPESGLFQPQTNETSFLIAPNNTLEQPIGNIQQNPVSVPISYPPVAPTSPVVNQSGRLLPFREIAAIPNRDERIKTYNLTRDQFASMDTGLQGWLAATITAYPEHASLLSAPTLRVTTSPTNATLGRAQHKVSPSMSRFTNILSPVQTSGESPTGPAAAGQKQTAKLPNASSSPASASPQGDGGNAGVKKGKEMLHSAGMLGGRAATVGKGLFAKGRSKFRASTGGDKALSQVRSASSTPPPSSQNQMLSRSLTQPLEAGRSSSRKRSPFRRFSRPSSFAASDSSSLRIAYDEHPPVPGVPRALSDEEQASSFLSLSSLRSRGRSPFGRRSRPTSMVIEYRPNEPYLPVPPPLPRPPAPAVSVELPEVSSSSASHGQDLVSDSLPITERGRSDSTVIEHKSRVANNAEKRASYPLSIDQNAMGRTMPPAQKQKSLRQMPEPLTLWPDPDEGQKTETQNVDKLAPVERLGILPTPTQEEFGLDDHNGETGQESIADSEAHNLGESVVITPLPLPAIEQTNTSFISKPWPKNPDGDSIDLSRRSSLLESIVRHASPALQAIESRRQSRVLDSADLPHAGESPMLSKLNQAESAMAEPEHSPWEKEQERAIIGKEELQPPTESIMTGAALVDSGANDASAKQEEEVPIVLIDTGVMQPRSPIEDSIDEDEFHSAAEDNDSIQTEPNIIHAALAGQDSAAIDPTKALPSGAALRVPSLGIADDKGELPPHSPKQDRDSQGREVQTGLAANETQVTPLGTMNDDEDRGPPVPPKSFEQTARARSRLANEMLIKPDTHAEQHLQRPRIPENRPMSFTSLPRDSSGCPVAEHIDLLTSERERSFAPQAHDAQVSSQIQRRQDSKSGSLTRRDPVRRGSKPEAVPPGLAARRLSLEQNATTATGTDNLQLAGQRRQTLEDIGEITDSVEATSQPHYDVSSDRPGFYDTSSEVPLADPPHTVAASSRRREFIASEIEPDIAFGYSQNASRRYSGDNRPEQNTQIAFTPNQYQAFQQSSNKSDKRKRQSLLSRMTRPASTTEPDQAYLSKARVESDQQLRPPNAASEGPSTAKTIVTERTAKKKRFSSLGGLFSRSESSGRTSPGNTKDSKSQKAKLSSTAASQNDKKASKAQGTKVWKGLRAREQPPAEQDNTPNTSIPPPGGFYAPLPGEHHGLLATQHNADSSQLLQNRELQFDQYSGHPAFRDNSARQAWNMTGLPGPLQRPRMPSIGDDGRHQERPWAITLPTGVESEGRDHIRRDSIQFASIARQQIQQQQEHQEDTDTQYPTYRYDDTYASNVQRTYYPDPSTTNSGPPPGSTRRPPRLTIDPANIVRQRIAEQDRARAMALASPGGTAFNDLPHTPRSHHVDESHSPVSQDPRAISTVPPGMRLQHVSSPSSRGGLHTLQIPLEQSRLQQRSSQHYSPADIPLPMSPLDGAPYTPVTPNLMVDSRVEVPLPTVTNYPAPRQDDQLAAESRDRNPSPRRMPDTDDSYIVRNPAPPVYQPRENLEAASHLVPSQESMDAVNVATAAAAQTPLVPLRPDFLTSVQRDGDDEPVVMHATSYPGMEWEPSWDE